MIEKIRYVRSGPYVDLSIIVGYTVAAALLLWLVPQLPTVVRILLSLPLIAFIPGYAVLAVLSSTLPDRSQTRFLGLFELADFSDHLAGAETLVLAVLTSTAVVPLITYAISLQTDITLPSILFGHTAFTLIFGLTAALKRRATSTTTEQTAVRRRDTTLLEKLNFQSAMELLPVLATIIALLLVVTSGAIAVMEVGTETPNTEISLLTETESGNLTADNYQQSFDTDDEAEYIVSITQYGEKSQRYTVVVAIEEISTEDGEREVTSVTELNRFTTVADPNERTLEPIRVSPPATDGEASLTVFLYKDSPPADVSRNSALRVVHIPIEVTLE